MNRIIRKIKHAKYKVKTTISNGAVLTRRALTKILCELRNYRSFGRLYDKNMQLLPLQPNWNKIVKFKRVVVDIGAGHGEVTKALGQNKDNLVISFETRSRFYRMIRHKTRNMENVFVFNADGYKLLPTLMKKESINVIYILFPDPWNKKRHYKRRAITAELLMTLVNYVYPGGYVLIATDHKDYQKFIRKEIKKLSKVHVGIGKYNPIDFGLPETHYYKKMHGGIFFKITKN